jgi:hypothetical protein
MEPPCRHPGNLWHSLSRLFPSLSYRLQLPMTLTCKLQINLSVAYTYRWSRNLISYVENSFEQADAERLTSTRYSAAHKRQSQLAVQHLYLLDA